MTDPTRREFVTRSAAWCSGAWLTANLPMIETVAANARRRFEQGAPFTVLTPDEARTMSAFAEQIIPSNDTPGAREAGAIYFIDGALATFMKDALPLVRDGIAALNAGARKKNKSVATFAELTSKQQIDVMRSQEKTAFFGLARTLALGGVFADPAYGGNRSRIGEQLLHMEHRAGFQPPFGYYDAEAAKGAAP